MKKLFSLFALTAFVVTPLLASNGLPIGADPCSDEDCPLEWTEALMDSNVECPSNLPTFCDEYYEYAGIEGLEAVNSCTGDTYEVATCFPLASQSLNLPVTTCMATTAQLNPEGNLGAVDGAVRLYNLHQTGLVDGEYFLEDPNNPLTLRYAPDSKTARLTGTVYCRENANQIFHVDARFDNEQVASEWLAESPQHSLLSDDACSLDADAISVFDLAPMSRLEGDGELEGTLFIDHYPATYSARFQLGEGANNHNCNYGFGGWFRWSGTLNGEYTEGTTGDIVVDLACSAAEEACSEYSEFLFEAVDDCGRILSTTVTVTRDDTQNPVVVSGPQDMTVECDNVPPMAPGSSITATDNCEGPLTITDGLELRIDGNCPSNYTLDRRWTITDACGNSTVHTQLVTVQDTTDPVIVAEDTVEIACEDWPVDTAIATASDNCGIVELTFSQMDGELGCIEPYTTYQRAYYAEDECGNSAVKAQTLVLVDNVAPEFTSVPESYTAECTDELVLDMATAMDNCGEPDVTVSTEIIPGQCDAEYTMVRTFTADDGCGNAVTATQTIDVVDSTAPTLMTVPYFEGFRGQFAAENWETTEGISVTGNALTIVGYDNVANPYDDGVIQTAIAPCLTMGGTVSFDWDYSLNDLFPSFDVGFYVNGELMMQLNETNSYEGSGSITFECNGGDIIGFGVDATDGCCGSATLVIDNFEVLGSEEPQALPGDLSFECDEVDQIPAAVTLYAMGNCSLAEVAFDESTVAGDCPQDYDIVRTWTASDECGNETIHTQTIQVRDTEAPEFTYVPADYTVQCAEDVVLEDATATDNCGEVSIAYETEIVNQSCPNKYQLIRAISATDECGNITIAQQTITVDDTMAPEFTFVPEDYTVQCAEDVVLEDATATDNCGELTIDYSVDTVNQSCPNKYQLIRTWVATDECDNSTTAQQTITVDDTIAPEFTFVPEDYTVQCAEDVVLEDATATDNCGELTIDYSVDTVNQSCPNKYQLIRTWVATDECDNSTTAQQTITVDDTIAPEFTFVPEDYTVECSDDVTYEEATAIDNCGELTIDYSVDTVGLECPNNFQIIRTWVATDECDNSTTAQQTITVEDTTAPEFTFVPADYTVECSDDVTYEDATAIDNCGEVTIEYSVDTVGLECPNNFEIVRTWIATDECDNSTTAQQTITVDDSTAPEFTFVPADYTVECSDDVTFDDAEAVDNCGEVTISYALDTLGLSCPNNFQILRTIVATDDCNNSETVVQTITVEDTTAPEFVSVPADYSIECTEEPTYGDVEVMDNCSDWEVVLTTDTIESGCDNVYDIVLTWTATDACDNESSASQTISVIDTSLPQITFSCGLENGEIVDVCCEDLSGSITVPAACELEAVDFACGGDLTISLTETYEGEYTPSETVDHWCVISEPQGMDQGLTCEGLTPHAMRLFNFPGDDFYSLIDGAVSHNVDGTMTYYMTLVSQSNPDAGWELEAQFTQPLDWFEWQNQPGNHSFKNDCGLGDHMEWEYSIMTSGEAQGWGEYEGSDMTLMHQPVSGYFGFQMGEGANNKNGNYGFSGWFYCSGTFDGAPFNTSGDIFGELECCLPWTLDRAYTVADCSGNTTTFHYEVHATGAPCINEEEGGVQDGEDQTMVSYKDLIKVLDLMPNPTTGMTQVTLFTEELGTTAQVSLFNMAGQEVMPLFNGQLNAGWPMPLMFDASDLEAGMYQLRIHSKNFVTSKKLLVAH